eukprot:scaffold132395_cov15-Prasinocladus_malaysianus.AAC.1
MHLVNLKWKKPNELELTKEKEMQCTAMECKGMKWSCMQRNVKMKELNLVDEMQNAMQWRGAK